MPFMVNGMPPGHAGQITNMNFFNGIGMKAPLGPVGAIITPIGPVLNWSNMTVPSAPQMFIVPPVVVPLPLPDIPMSGMAGSLTVMLEFLPVFTCSGFSMSIPGPGPGVASGTPTGPCRLVPIPV